MDFVIGSRYQENKANLKDRIREGNIEVLEAEPSFHVCYFCCRLIREKMFVLVNHPEVFGRESETKYFLDEFCFEDSKLSVQ